MSVLKQSHREVITNLEGMQISIQGWGLLHGEIVSRLTKQGSVALCISSASDEAFRYAQLHPFKGMKKLTAGA